MVCSLLLLVSLEVFGQIQPNVKDKWVNGGIKAIKFLWILQVKVATCDQWNDGWTHAVSCYWAGCCATPGPGDGEESWRIQERDWRKFEGKVHMWEANQWQNKVLLVLLFIELFFFNSFHDAEKKGLAWK